MGDAEGEPGEMAVLDAGSGDHEAEGAKSSGGGCGSGAGAGGGVSLPPRKRLLVGLKHSGSSNNNHSNNNGWVAAGAPLSPSSVCPDGLVSMSEGALLEAAEKKKEREQDEDEDACVRCGAKETAAWRRVKKDGIYQRLCNSCTLLYMCCPYCLVVYQDAATVGDPSVWLNCCHCRRSVHIECELKSSSGSAPEPSTYVCSECRKNRDLSGKGCEDEGAVVDGAVRAPSSPTSPCSKKARTTTAEKEKQESVAGRPSPQEEAVTAARDAAALALKAAATAKATALAKAQAAVKAAMLAKTALENAALAAKGDFRKSTTRMEAKVKLEVSEKTKTEISTPEANDEELARQLHRAMNSSTRNSRLPRKI